MTESDQQSTLHPTTIEFRYVHPLQTGKVLACLYGFISLVFVPLVMLGPMMRGADGAAAVIPLVMMIILYPLMGFIGGLIVASLYDFIAKRVGGFRIDVS